MDNMSDCLYIHLWVIGSEVLLPGCMEVMLIATIAVKCACAVSKVTVYMLHTYSVHICIRGSIVHMRNL